MTVRCRPTTTATVARSRRCGGRADGTWLVGPGPPVQWGEPGDVPVPADYDGDGSADLAVWRPVDGDVARPRRRHLPAGRATITFRYRPTTTATGTPIPARGRRRPQRWFVRGREPRTFGEPGDVPVPGQYDGDGRADLAVRAAGVDTEGTWIIRERGSSGSANQVTFRLCCPKHWLNRSATVGRGGARSSVGLGRPGQ